MHNALGKCPGSAGTLQILNVWLGHESFHNAPRYQTMFRVQWVHPVPATKRNSVWWATIRSAAMSALGPSLTALERLVKQRIHSYRYLSGPSGFMPTRSVFEGWCRCCLICAHRVSRSGGYVG